MKKNFLIFVFVLFTCIVYGQKTKTIQNDPLQESKEEYDKRAQWLRDAKFGLFIHWNASSQIGKEISWCRNEYGREKYDSLYLTFTASKFNADEWLNLFEKAGVKYITLVPKHHDGFCMFETKTDKYNVMNTPFGRDYIKEMADACAKNKQVKLCLYYSIMDWWSKDYKSEEGANLSSYLELMKIHFEELLTKYGKIGYIWFDGNWEKSWTHANGKEMYTYARKLQPGTLMGNRIEPKPGKPQPELVSTQPGVLLNNDLQFVGSFYDAADAVGDFQAREMMYGNYYDEKAWDACYNLNSTHGNGGWSFMPPIKPRPTEQMLNFLIQCIGRDGAMLLGIGPTPDGTIDSATTVSLLSIGEWLKLYGDAVYGTRGGPWLPGEWGVSTRKGDKVYLFIQKWNGNSIVLPSLSSKLKSVRALTGGDAKIVQNAENIEISLPEKFYSTPATIIELTFKQDVMLLKPVKTDLK